VRARDGGGAASANILVAAAWVLMLAASGLPRVVLQELLHVEVGDSRSLLAASAVGLGFGLAALWARLRPLLPFLVLLAVLVGTEWLVYRVIDQAPVLRAWLADPSFSTFMLAEQSLRLMVTLAVIGALLALRRRPARFFLIMGDLRAPMRRVRDAAALVVERGHFPAEALPCGSRENAQRGRWKSARVGRHVG